MQGIHSIEASAGTGKTYSITIVWLRMLLHEVIPVEHILVSTFTKAATAEVQERLLEALNEARSLCATSPNVDEWPNCPAHIILQQCLQEIEFGVLTTRIEQALSNFDLAPIRTIHGLCNDILRQHALEIAANPDAESQPDLGDLQQQVIDDLVIAANNENQLQELGEQSLNDITRIVSTLVRHQDIALDDILPSPEDANAAPWHEKLEHAKAQVIARENDWQILKGASLKACVTRRDAALSGEAYEPLKGKGAEILAEQAPELFAAYKDLITAGSKVQQAPLQRARRNLIERSRQMIRQRQAAAGIVTYDDLILIVRDALRSAHGPEIAHTLRQRYRGVIIDECQDSDGVQIEIFRQLFCEHDSNGAATGNTAAPTQVFLVIGDPKQSIYRFRRADLASYRDLANLATAHYTMDTNYRSDGDCISACNELYARAPEFSSPVRVADGDLTQPPITYQAVQAAAPRSRLFDPHANRGAVSFIWSTQDNRSLATADLIRQSAAEIYRLLSDTSVSILDRHSQQPRNIIASDIAILAAKHDDLWRCRRELSHLGLPCQMTGRASVYSSTEALELAIWLELLTALEEGNGDYHAAVSSFAHTALVPSLGRTDTALDAQLALLDLAQQHLLDLQRDGPLTMLRRHLEQYVDLHDSEAERRWSNWMHIMRLLQDTWWQGRRRARALHELLLQHIELPPFDENDDCLVLETDEPAVQLVTIHGSKGLEYPIVFCPLLWSFSDPRSVRSVRATNASGQDFLDLYPADRREHIELDKLLSRQEHERTTYVALTRARHRTYIGLAPVGDSRNGFRNGAQRSPLATILGLADSSPDTWMPPQDVYPTPKENPLFAISDINDTQTADRAETPTTVPNGSLLTDLTPPPVRPWFGQRLSRIGSFSSLSKHHHNHREETPDEDLLRDRDPIAEPEIAGAAEATGQDLLLGLGAGAALGTQIHDMLEQHLAEGQSLADCLPKTERTGLTLKNGDGEIDETVTGLWLRALQTITTTPLEAANLPALSALRDRCIAEMHFLVPATGIHPAALSAALLTDSSIAEHSERRRWAESIATWESSTLEGYLQGYIDLIVEHQGKWFIIDYKTNLLPAYDNAHLEHAMLQAHYILQGRIYWLALHRHLSATLPGYQPAEHLGGIAYLFVRGMPNQGTWFDQPDPHGLVALNQLTQPPTHTQQQQCRPALTSDAAVGGRR
jgi:exodeoxyribonuclease V beta subunit